MLNIIIRPDKRKLIIYIALIITTLGVYWQVNNFDFVNYDDPVFVTDNEIIQHGITLDGIRWAFSTNHCPIWIPLVWLSLMLNYQLWGLNAGGYHVTNLIFHILNTLLLFWLFCRMTKEIWKSAFVAAFFAMHPLHVESVAWIVERKDVLSTFFWILSLCMYVYYTQKPTLRRYLLVVFCFVLDMMSKPMVITLPLIMIILDYWPLKRFESRKENSFLWQLKEKLPFLILSSALAIFTIYTTNKIDNYGTNTIIIPFFSRLDNAAVSFVTYLEKTFYPHDMAIFYPFETQILHWQVFGAVLLILVVTTFVLVMAKRIPSLFVGWLWFTITIAPVIGIIQISMIAPYAMADRYHYLPSIGIAVILAWGITYLIKSESTRKKILFPMGIIFIAILSFMTYKQCAYWKNSKTLFRHAIQVTRNNYLAYNNLGFQLSREGKIMEALYHYNKAISIAPDFPGYYNNRGNAYVGIGNYQLAIADFDKAIFLSDDFAEAYYNRGTLYGKSNKLQIALKDLNKAISLKPSYVMAYNNRGLVYTKLRLYQQALNDFNEALCLRPNYADAYSNRAVIYLNTRNVESGCSDAKKACELKNCTALLAARNKGYCR